VGFIHGAGVQRTGWRADGYGARFPTGIYTRGCHWFPRMLCSLEASMRATNGTPLGCTVFLLVHTVNCVYTLKVCARCRLVSHPASIRGGRCGASGRPTATNWLLRTVPGIRLERLHSLMLLVPTHAKASSKSFKLSHACDPLSCLSGCMRVIQWHPSRMVISSDQRCHK
jgi:hypothetical protein